MRYFYIRTCTHNRTTALAHIQSIYPYIHSFIHPNIYIHTHIHTHILYVPVPAVEALCRGLSRFGPMRVLGDVRAHAGLCTYDYQYFYYKTLEESL